ncbi:beta-L-arabinofuranosidase domain-containing protein [Streptomyces sp. NPDC002795]|uniref:beta-L-arabinofuranosidase domain-containing protein n=1 Tax=Streptomyces sp. NPDC002795 TaxID=3364665 RepID=UPI0036C39FEF
MTGDAGSPKVARNSRAKRFKTLPGAAALGAAPGYGGTALAAAAAEEGLAADGASGAAPAPALAEVPLRDVTLLDSPFRADMRRTCAYLKAVDPDRLLHTFRTNVGLPSDAEPCGGWEAPDVQLRGPNTGERERCP